MQLKTLEEGAWRVVAKVDHRGRCDVLDALDALANDKATKATAAGFKALWRVIPREGPHELPDDSYHCVDTANGIYEFIKRRHRALCFIADGRLVVCACVFIKKSKKVPKAEVARAIRLKEEFLAATQSGEVEYV